MSANTSSHNGPGSRLLAGLDQDAVLSHPTRSRGTRQANVLYDLKFHPMDEELDSRRYNAHRRRQGLSPVLRSSKAERLYSGRTSDAEASSSEPELSDGESVDDEEDLPTLSDGLEPSATNNPSKGKSTREYVPIGHAIDTLATRRSNRLQTQEIKRPLYNAKFHPDDENIPFYRGIGKKRKREERTIAKQEIRAKRGNSLGISKGQQSISDVLSSTNGQAVDVCSDIGSDHKLDARGPATPYGEGFLQGQSYDSAEERLDMERIQRTEEPEIPESAQKSFDYGGVPAYEDDENVENVPREETLTSDEDAPDEDVPDNNEHEQGFMIEDEDAESNDQDNIPASDNKVSDDMLSQKFLSDFRDVTGHESDSYASEDKTGGDELDATPVTLRGNGGYQHEDDSPSLGVNRLRNTIGLAPIGHANSSAPRKPQTTYGKRRRSTQA